MRRGALIIAIGVGLAIAWSCGAGGPTFGPTSITLNSNGGLSMTGGPLGVITALGLKSCPSGNGLIFVSATTWTCETVVDAVGGSGNLVLSTTATGASLDLATSPSVTDISVTGRIRTNGATAVSSVTFCGTSPSILSGSTVTAGTVQVGTSAGGTCQVNWPSTQASIPFCTCSSDGMSSGSAQGDPVSCKSTTTKLTIADATGSTIGLDTEDATWHCEFQ